MKLYSDTLTEQDIRQAAQVAGVYVWEMARIRRPRTRANGWNLYLTGSSSYASQATGEKAATWDEHGVFMDALYQLDPEMKVAHYNDYEQFMQDTRRVVLSPWNLEQPDRKKKRGPWLGVTV